MSPSKEDKKSVIAEKRSSSSTVVKIIQNAQVATPKDNKRTPASSPGTRKLLNESAGSSDKVKQEKRQSTARIKILNEETLAGRVKGEKRVSNSPTKTAKKPASPATTVTILNDKRIASATPISVETTKIKTAASKKKKMDHYVLQAVKSESNHPVDHGDGLLIEDDEEGAIAFILAEDDQGLVEEIAVSGDDISDNEQPIGEIEGGEVLSDQKNNSGVKEIMEHVCGKCYKTFRRVKSLKKHLEFCRYDSGYHLRKADMLKNLEKIEKDAVVMEKKDICFCCSESYDTFHLGHINCPDCPKSFKTQTSYERHIFITHSEFNDYPCSICNAKLRSEALLKLHEVQHQIRGKPYACKICGKDFTRSYHLKRHQKYSSCSANENDTMSCKVCDRVFYRLDNLRAHLKQHLGTQIVKKPEYMCEVCKNCFYSLSTLNIHIRTHTGEKPFDCDLCDKKFSALVALKKHRRYHTGEKPYSCAVCNQSFAVKEVLNRHMKRHTGERPHKCNECGKSFIQATQLRTHSKTHLRPFPCDQCDEKYKTEKQLERHMKDHARQKRTKFMCTECKKSFRSAELLEEHNAAGIHTTPKPKAPKRQAAKMIERTDCAICDKNFDSQETLRSHIRNVHECDPDDIFGTTPPAAKRPRRTRKPVVEAVDEEEEEEEEEEASAATHPPGELISSNIDDNGVVVREFLVDEGNGTEQSIVLDEGTFTIMTLDEPEAEAATTTTTRTRLATKDVKPESSEMEVSPKVKKEQRKSLAASLAAAIADNHDDQVSEDDFSGEILTEDDLKLKENIAKLIDMLVDPSSLKKYGWPNTSEEITLCKVIENCGHDLKVSGENYTEMDYGTRMREYCKLLFTVVIHNDSIKSLLNNFPIDDVIEYVLGNDEDGPDEGKETDVKSNADSEEADEDEKFN